MARFRIPAAAFAIVKEAARHLLRRPIVRGRWRRPGRQTAAGLLVRRADMGEWALPGGTLEWGESLRTSIARELAE